MSEFLKGVLTGSIGLAVVEAVVIFLVYKFMSSLRITG